MPGGTNPRSPDSRRASVRYYYPDLSGAEDPPPPEPPKRSHRRLWLLIVILVLVGAYATRESVYRWMGSSLIKTAPPRVCDAIVVCGGNDSQREEAAVELWRQGIAPRIVLTGAVVGWRHSQARIMAEHVVSMGVPEAVVVIQQPTASIFDAARLLRGTAKARGWTAVTVVTAPMESRLAWNTFAHWFPGPYYSATVYAYDETLFGPDSWWTCWEGRNEVALQWARLFASRLRYHV